MEPRAAASPIQRTRSSTYLSGRSTAGTSWPGSPRIFEISAQLGGLKVAAVTIALGCVVSRDYDGHVVAQSALRVIKPINREAYAL